MYVCVCGGGGVCVSVCVRGEGVCVRVCVCVSECVSVCVWGGGHVYVPCLVY